MKTKSGTIVKCPNCHKDVKIDIANGLDEDGELFKCPYCNYFFRYTER